MQFNAHALMMICWPQVKRLLGCDLFSSHGSSFWAISSFKCLLWRHHFPFKGLHDVNQVVKVKCLQLLCPEHAATKYESIYICVFISPLFSQYLSTCLVSFCPWKEHPLMRLSNSYLGHVLVMKCFPSLSLSHTLSGLDLRVAVSSSTSGQHACQLLLCVGKHLEC